MAPYCKNSGNIKGKKVYTDGCTTKKRRSYSTERLKIARLRVLEGTCCTCKTAKQFSIPCCTEHFCSEGDARTMGTPSALSATTETKLMKFVTEMQERGFGLTANRVRHTAYSFAEKQYRASKECFPFRDTKSVLVGAGTSELV
jgi:hypothetical protein